MPINRQIQFLVCYDIADPRRLQKIHRKLKKSGIPVQYSVFSLVCCKPKLLNLLDQLDALMDEREDDLRCYTLPAEIDCKTLGRQMFPDDIMLFSKGVSCLFGGC